ncbi:MAG: GNAT family N-acetyltransferase [Nocardioidaceae bacterium]
MTLEIRAARPHELDTVGEITAAAYADDGFIYLGHDYVEVLRDATSRAEGAELWVAVDADQEVLGTVTFCPAGSSFRELAGDGEGEFRMLAVHSSARRRGVADALVQRCIVRSRELGDHRIVICSDHGMDAAHRLYARLGFRRAPDLDWSPAPGIDLLAFSLDL